MKPKLRVVTVAVATLFLGLGTAFPAAAHEAGGMHAKLGKVYFPV